MVAAIGNGAAFAKGRDFAAWFGLVPKQMSTGDRTILARISKRGNRYLRTLFMQGARVILLRRASWANHSFGPWSIRDLVALPASQDFRRMRPNARGYP
jgi:transposase